MPEICVTKGFCFSWKAKNFDFDRSCDFEFNSKQWYLVFRHETKGSFSLWMRPTSLRNQVYLPFSVLCFALDSAESRGFGHTFTRSSDSWNFRIWNASCSSVFQEMKNFAANGEVEFVLILRELESNDDLHTCTGVECNDHTLEPDLESLSSDFSHLLTSGDASDVQIKCGDVTRPAHRLVLAARSDVFSAMFRNEMAESCSGIVDIEGLDATVLDLFLKYVYSGKLSYIPEGKVHDLYYLADKYAVHFLKKLCSDWMTNSLSVDNYKTCLVMADIHNDKTFKTGLIAAIINNHPEWLDSETWHAFSEEHSKLAIEVYSHFCSQTYFKRRCGSSPAVFSHARRKMEVFLKKMQTILVETTLVLTILALMFKGLRPKPNCHN